MFKFYRQNELYKSDPQRLPLDRMEAPRTHHRVLDLALPFLPIDTWLAVRCTSRWYNAKFIRSLPAHCCTFSLQRGTNFYSEAHIEALLQTRLRAYRIKLIGLPLTSFFFSNPDHFRVFVRKFDFPWLKSLHLIDCQITMGRFMELIAFLGVRDLRIINCPTLLQTDLAGVANFDHIIPVFIQQVGLLRSFELRGDKLIEANQYQLLRHLKHLHRLRISTRKCPLSKKAISDCIDVNRRTLTSLHLEGRLDIDDTFVQDVFCRADIDYRLKLQHLTLGWGARIAPMATNAFCNEFLRRQHSHLQSLQLRSISIPRDFKFPSGMRLKSVVIWDCFFQECGLEDFWKSLSRVLTLRALEIGFENRDSPQAQHFKTKALKNMFETALPRLERLEFFNFGGEDNGAQPIQFMKEVREQCGNLRSLALVGCCLPASQLKHICTLTQLKELTLKGCGLVTETLARKCPHGGADQPCIVGLARLTQLEYLDLSNNPKLDGSIFLDIRRLQNLRILNVEKCKEMNQKTLLFLIKILGANKNAQMFTAKVFAGASPESLPPPPPPERLLPNLEQLFMGGCPGCFLFSADYLKINKALYPLTVDVDIKMGPNYSGWVNLTNYGLNL